MKELPASPTVRTPARFSIYCPSSREACRHLGHWTDASRHSGRTNLRLHHGRRPRTRAVAVAMSMSRTENSRSCRSTLSADGARQWLRTTCYGKHHCRHIILGWKNLRLQQVLDATGSNRNDPAQHRTRFAAPGGEQLPRVIIASGTRICIRE